MYSFDIYGHIGKEIQEFNDDKILIAGKQEDTGRYLNKAQKGYYFNQKETLELIDLYYNSKFESGELDSEGQRKLFLNICAFRADVASKMIDLDTKDFVFKPDELDYKWTAYFLNKEFKEWAREQYFGDLINEFVEYFPKQGTVVSKRIGHNIERVPLKNLINQQDARDLKTARYVIEMHPDMTLTKMKKFKDWDLSGLEIPFGKTITVYERYGEIPLRFYNEVKGIDNDGVEENETIDAVIICTLEQKKSKGWTGNILFIEECKERPYEEVHWKRQDGRWLGIGEIENQFENQIARNMIANMRRRALLWSSKKIFQSPDTELARNLIRDVKDGDVMRIMPNGNITQVDVASRQMGEYQSAENEWEKNSDQKSFTFEVATGESLPSGTPFRLGVVLSNAVNSHFGLKREKLGLFIKKVILEQVFEIFKKENRKEHKIVLFAGEKGMTNLKKVLVEMKLNKKLEEWAMSDGGVMPDVEAEKLLLEERAKELSALEVVIPDNAYDEAKCHLILDPTGEETNVESKIETYTTLYQTMVQAGDPRAEQILEKIVSLTGENLEAELGEKQEPQQVAGPTQTPVQSSLDGLAALNAPEQSIQ